MLGWSVEWSGNNNRIDESGDWRPGGAVLASGHKVISVPGLLHQLRS